MADKCTVWTDLGGTEPIRLGLATHSDRTGEFNYADGFVDAAGRSIDPINLPLAARTVYRTAANRGVFGVIDDAGPDSWGKRVLKALDPKKFANANPLDLLLMTSGYGIGTLMFSTNSHHRPVRQKGISRADLGAFAEGAHTVELGEVPAAHLRELMRAATTAGGVHPKIQMSDPDGTEWIAKFRSLDDVIDTPRVECAAMRLARLHCGINAAHVESTAIGDRCALLIRRFDREHGFEHYASAHALWNRVTAAADATTTWASYAGIVQLRRKLPGDGVSADAVELFRRLVFNIIIGNTDDHGRNHGFLMNTAGQWRLSPAFDVLPAVQNQVNIQALGVGPRGPVRSFDNAIDGAADFGLDRRQATDIIDDVAANVRQHYARLLSEASCSTTDIAVVLARCMYPN